MERAGFLVVDAIWEFYQRGGGDDRLFNQKPIERHRVIFLAHGLVPGALQPAPIVRHGHPVPGLNRRHAVADHNDIARHIRQWDARGRNEMTELIALHDGQVAGIEARGAYLDQNLPRSRFRCRPLDQA